MIEWIVLSLVGGGIASVAVALSRAKARARFRVWVSAAESCGVTDLMASDAYGAPQQLDGRKGDLDVEIGSYMNKDGQVAGTRIVVGPLTPVAALRLRVEGVGTSIMKSLAGTREVHSGDPDFDRLFLIEGPTALALAVLDAATRRQVSESMGGEVVIDGTDGDIWLKARADLANGRLTMEVADGSDRRHDEHLAGALSTILSVAETLAAPLDVPRRLSGNAQHDPLWGVRLVNLRTLAREWPDRAETTATLRAACSDPDEDVRLHAALALGGEADATLVALAFGDAPDAVTARAIAGLGDRVPLDRAGDALRNALDAERVETACAWMDALGGGAAAAGAEPLLVAALAHADERVRVAAACALGSVASVAAVLPLQEAAQRFGGELGRLSRQAIAEIQSRAAGATPGQVSLAQDGEGRVSLPDAAGGEVSIPDTPAR